VAPLIWSFWSVNGVQSFSYAILVHHVLSVGSFHAVTNFAHSVRALALASVLPAQARQVAASMYDPLPYQGWLSNPTKKRLVQPIYKRDGLVAFLSLLASTTVCPTLVLKQIAELSGSLSPVGASIIISHVTFSSVSFRYHHFQNEDLYHHCYARSSCHHHSCRSSTNLDHSPPNGGKYWGHIPWFFA